MAMDGASAGSVAVIPIIGEFLKYGSQCTYGANEIVPAIYKAGELKNIVALVLDCLLYTSPSPRDGLLSRMPSSA